MKLGVTGTQNGMTAKQMRAFATFIVQRKPSEFHFGDCIGADEQMFTLILRIQQMKPWECRIVMHPPDIDTKRANCNPVDETWAPRPYLVRNQDIVNCSDELIATPKELNEQLRSGTWSTVRRARIKEIPVHILEP
jgi:hypothetical protein